MMTTSKSANIRFVSLLCLVVLSGNTSAYFLNMKDLMKLWRSSNEQSRNIVRGYVYATYDSTTTDDKICLPVGKSIEKSVEEVLVAAEASYNFASENLGITADDKSIPATWFIAGVWKKLHPCKPVMK